MKNFCFIDGFLIFQKKIMNSSVSAVNMQR